MKFASKFIGALVVKFQSFKLVKGVLSVAGPTNTQKDVVESHNFSINGFAEVCMLPLCHLQLLSRPRVFTVLDFNQVHIPLATICVYPFLPSCYRALVKREEGDSKEEVPGSDPCGRGGDEDALCRWESL
eukprot:1138085-Pelagomonas_calceolata.AAC.2